MRDFTVRWRSRHRSGADPLPSTAPLFRAESKSAKGNQTEKPATKKAPAPPELPPEPPPEPPPSGGPPPPASLYARTIGRIPPERRSLYASAGLVVAIVVVIIALASRPTHRVMHWLPKGPTRVKVLHVDRFYNSPVYAALREADHPVLESFDSLQERLNLSLRHQVSVLATTGGGDAVFFGRFPARRVRSAFEEAVEADLAGRMPYLRTRYVEDYAYTFTAREGVDRAVTTIGSSVGATGSRRFVRRLLKVRAGLTDSLRQDDALWQAYDDPLARVAIVYAIEKAGGPRLKSLAPIITPPAAPAEKGKAAKQPPAKKKAPRPAPKKGPANPLVPGKGLGDLLAPGGAAVNPLAPLAPPQAPEQEAAQETAGPQAAFFALSARSAEVRLGIRIATSSDEAAEAAAKHLKTAGPQAALGQLIGVEDAPTVYHEGPVVAIKAIQSIEAFTDLAMAHKERPTQTQSLFLDLIIR